MPPFAGAKLFFRPQNARLALAGNPAETASVRVRGQVSHKEFLGAAVRYGIRTEGGEVFADIPHACGEAHLPDEQIVGVDIPLSRVNYLPA